MDAMQTYFNKRRYTLLKSENSTTSNTPVPDWLGKRPLPPIPQKEKLSPKNSKYESIHSSDYLDMNQNQSNYLDMNKTNYVNLQPNQCIYSSTYLYAPSYCIAYQNIRKRHIDQCSICSSKQVSNILTSFFF